MYRSLEAAGVAERPRDDNGRCAGVRVGSLVEGEDERSALRFSAPLMTFAIEVIATFDRDDPAYVVDVVSVVEAVLDDPRQMLFAQQNAAKAAEVARLKAEGVPYEERMERLESITWPRPLAELLATLFATYRRAPPVGAEEPSPKSILREMLEGGDSFATFVRRYRLERSEGLVLRYLTDAWRTLDRSLPDDAYTDGARGRRRVARRADPGHRRDAARRVDAARRSAGPRPPRARGAAADRAGPPPAWRTAVRTAAFGWVELLATRAYGALAERSGWSEERLRDAMAPYWAEYDAHRHRRRCTVGGAVHAHRGTGPVGGHPTTDGSGRRRRVALRRVHRPRAGEAEGAPTLQLESLGRF